MRFVAEREERVNEARDEKERLQRIVADSEGAEKQLRDLTDRRMRKQEDLAVATDCVGNLERLTVVPHLVAAGIADIDALDAKVTET
jgi:hypothetical protein